MRKYTSAAANSIIRTSFDGMATLTEFVASIVQVDNVLLYLDYT